MDEGMHVWLGARIPGVESGRVTSSRVTRRDLGFPQGKASRTIARRGLSGVESLRSCCQK